jgi:hypothetical protein
VREFLKRSPWGIPAASPLAQMATVVPEGLHASIHSLLGQKLNQRVCAVDGLFENVRGMAEMELAGALFVKEDVDLLASGRLVQLEPFPGGIKNYPRRYSRRRLRQNQFCIGRLEPEVPNHPARQSTA